MLTMTGGIYWLKRDDRRQIYNATRNCCACSRAARRPPRHRFHALSLHTRSSRPFPAPRRIPRRGPCGYTKETWSCCALWVGAWLAWARDVRLPFADFAVCRSFNLDALTDEQAKWLEALYSNHLAMNEYLWKREKAIAEAERTVVRSGVQDLTSWSALGRGRMRLWVVYAPRIVVMCGIERLYASLLLAQAFSAQEKKSGSRVVENGARAARARRRAACLHQCWRSRVVAGPGVIRCTSTNAQRTGLVGQPGSAELALAVRDSSMSSSASTTAGSRLSSRLANPLRAITHRTGQFSKHGNVAA